MTNLTGAEVVLEGAKASQIFMCLCLKPETSEMRFHAIVKVKIFSTFPAFPKGTLGRVAICSLSTVLKNRYFSPCHQLTLLQTGNL